MLKDKIIGVLFGGRNTEHEISIITGEFLISKLKKFGYKVKAIYVDKEGRWYLSEKISKLSFFEGEFKKELKNLPEYYLNLTKSQSKIVLEKKGLLNKETITLDYLFPTFHGLNGEDGTIQGFAEFFNVPYAGCGVYCSSLSINKILTKKLLNSLNLPTTNFLYFTKEQFLKNKNEIFAKIKKDIKFPLFVKPSLCGSSIGISKVKDEEKLEEALEIAFYYDTQVIVEESVENIADLTCAILSDGEKVITSQIQKSLFEDDLFDFSSKYEKDGGAQTGNADKNLVIPADIDKDIEEKIKNYSKKVFDETQGNGIMRIDFLLNQKTKELFVNEINTLPGTLYHHLWEKSGIDFKQVVENILKNGQKRWDNYQELNKDYKTDVLNNANSLKLKN